MPLLTGEALAALRDQQGVHPWESLDAPSKVRVLSGLMGTAIEKLVGELLTLP